MLSAEAGKFVVDTAKQDSFMKKPEKELKELLDLIFLQAQMQFGPAIRSRWLHAEDDCPGCGGELNVVKFKKKKALSLNAFIFREHGVLIAYMLCSKCANAVIKLGETHPHGTTPLHQEIEKNLKAAYLKHQGH